MQEKIDLSAFLDGLADAAAAAILPYFRGPLSVENKHAAGFDPVTIADRAAETAMRTLIESTYPADGIVGEEHGAIRVEAENVWVLDPIDGTRAFIAGLSTWGTLIGLMRRGKPVLGMMAQPYVGERFWGDGGSAWSHGPAGRCQLATRPCPSLSEAVLMTTSPARFTEEERPLYDAIEREVRLVRYGTDCYGYCMVAAGHADVVIESGLQPYDVVALAPIVEGAGGVMTTWTGGSPASGGRIVACGDPRLHERVLARLSVM